MGTRVSMKGQTMRGRTVLKCSWYTHASTEVRKASASPLDSIVSVSYTLHKQERFYGTFYAPIYSVYTFLKISK